MPKTSHQNFAGPGGCPTTHFRSAGIIGLLVCLTVSSSQAADPIRIVSLGDSITKGVRTGVAENETFSHYLERAETNSSRPVEVRNVGIGGEQTDQALKRLDRDVLSLKPKFVLVMYGHNDSYVDVGQTSPRISVEEYAENLKRIVKQLRAGSATPILMTPPAYSNGNKNGIGEDPDILLELYVRAVRETSVRLEVPIVDHYAVWRERRDKGEEIRELTTDGYHPNPAGHKLIAETILPVVNKLITD